MQQDNKQPEALPLYKRLNEERTQGEWGKYKDYSFDLRPTVEIKNDGSNEAIVICCVNQYIPEGEANAQYTALAVNEFANTVDLLDICYRFFQHKEGDFYINNIKSKILQLCPEIRQTLNQVRQQLEKIS